MYYWLEDYVSLDILKDKTMKSVEVNDSKTEITFTTVDDEKFVMLHIQDCCEDVSIDDISGDLDDLVGATLLVVEERTSYDWPDDIEKPDYLDSYTWTFYTFRTVKGTVDIRWYGSSNGYYSEDVNLVRYKEA